MTCNSSISISISISYVNILRDCHAVGSSKVTATLHRNSQLLSILSKYRSCAALLTQVSEVLSVAARGLHLPLQRVVQ